MYSQNTLLGCSQHMGTGFNSAAPPNYNRVREEKTK